MSEAAIANSQHSRTEMITPTVVNPAPDGHPRGRHMIDAFRSMAVAARASAGKHQGDMAEVYDMAALCIENEAKRADRAEARLAEVPQPHKEPRT